MKTRIFLQMMFMMILLLPLELQGQVKLGIHAGMNLETQAELGQLWNNSELFPGYLVGGSVEYGLGKGLSVQAELNYQTKGERVKAVLNGNTAEIKRNFNYLSVPVLIRKNISDPALGDKWQVTMFAGPYAGYLLSADSKVTIAETTEKENIDNQTEKSDFGALFGGGVIYKIGNGHSITAEMRYGMGLSKIDKNNPDLRNKGIGITIGYSF